VQAAQGVKDYADQVGYNKAATLASNLALFASQQYKPGHPSQIIVFEKYFEALQIFLTGSAMVADSETQQQLVDELLLMSQRLAG
jgi:hypothetical protein